MKPSDNHALTDYFDFLVSHGGQQLSRAITLWKKGVESELNFWSHVFEAKGSAWSEDIVNRLKVRPLEPGLAQRLPKQYGSEVSTILDVGAGPITLLGTFLPDRPISVIACDPLARIYDKIIDFYGIDVPLRSVFSFAEDLSARFDESSFDLVCCTNALDHSIEPAWGILEMLMVVKTGGWICLNHARNEAERGDYGGLHQWNFDEADGDFIVWNKERTINIPELIHDFADIQCIVTDDWITTFIRKTNNVPIDSNTYHRKIRAALLDALIADGGEQQLAGVNTRLAETEAQLAEAPARTDEATRLRDEKEAELQQAQARADEAIRLRDEKEAELQRILASRGHRLLDALYYRLYRIPYLGGLMNSSRRVVGEGLRWISGR